MKRTASRLLVQSAVAGAIAGTVAVVALTGLASGEPSPSSASGTVTTGDASSTPSGSGEGSTAGTSAGGAPVDACALVTQTEAEAALRSPVTVVAAATTCTYVTQDASGRALAVSRPSAELAVEDLAAGAQQIAGATGGESRALGGVGDQAFAVLSRTVAQGLAREGDAFVVAVLTAPAGSADDQAAQLATLLRSALSRA